ncbi:MAG: glutamate--tRNA ligase [Candidatus Omnitrophica bacterium]|nr:glutamate--tRNA ligase [Candidatus Omnitrophota bacterium]
MVRVRFAPSPTGFLHIGGARTALFNWLYAQSQKGTFILRIEDTDAARSKKQYLDEILYSLEWLGFRWDELYYQSQRFDIYREYAQRLVKEKKAYYAEKMPIEETANGDGNQQKENKFYSEQTKHAIILKVPQQKTSFVDLIRGPIEFDTSVIKDQVLIKSDGTPTYNFACVIDDALMNITHVIRGDDHISNTPKQLLLYEALGFKQPFFAHLPLILAKEGGRLSKRKGATAISEFRAQGYLPEALVNFLLLLGWSPGADREIIDIKEAIQLFDIRKVNKTAAVLDLEKLNWINSEYIKRADADKLAEQIIPLLCERNLIDKNNFDRNYLISLIKLFQSRMTFVHDFIERADSFFVKEVTIDPKDKERFLNRNLSREFSLFLKRIESLSEFKPEAIEAEFRALVSELGIQSKDLIHPLRVALTGKTVGPGLFEVIAVLGKERTKERLSRWIKQES